MKHIIFPLLLTAFCFSTAVSQTYRQYMKAADEEFANLNYYSAMKHYQEAMSIEGEKPADIDLVEIHGYGFPRHKGGPMFASEG